MNFLRKTAKLIRKFSLKKEKPIEIGEISRKSGQNFGILFENSPAVMLLIDPQTFSIITANNAAAKFYGWNREKLERMKISDINTLASQEIKTEMERARKAERTSFRFKHRLANGDVRDVEVYSGRVEIDGKDYLHSIIHDVSKQAQTERSLKESENKYRCITENSTDWIYFIDIQGRVLYASPSCERITGYTPADFVNDPQLLKKIIHPDDLPIARNHDQCTAKSEEHHEIDFRIISRNNQVRWIRHTCKPVFDDDGRYSGRVGTNRDVTVRKVAQEALRKSQERFRVAQDSSPDGFTILHPYRNEENEIIDFTWVYENKAIAGINKTNPEEVIGERLLEFFPPFKETTIFKSYCEVANSGKPKILEEVYIGEEVSVPSWLRLVIVPMEEDIAILAQDITESKNAKAEVVASEQRFRTIVEGAPEPIFIQIDYKFAYLNKPALKLFGANSATELIGRPVMERFHPDFHNVIQQRIKRLNEYKKPVHETAVLKYLRLNGEEVWVETTGEPILYNGEHGALVFVRDISVKWEMQKELRKISQAVQKSPVTIIITDAEGVIEYVNPQFTEITGYTPGEVIGKNPRILKSGKQSVSFYKELWETLLSGETWKGEFHNKKKSGDLYWASASISPLADNKGNITHFVAVEEDISERKRMYNDLVEAKENAQAADRLKTEFLNNISHEVRTPLNGILGVTELVTEPGISDEEKQDALKILRQSGDRLIDTITSYMDISLLQSGNMRPNKKTVSLNLLISGIYERFEKSGKDKGLGFNLDLPEQDIQIETDENLLEKILAHLLSNSLKFTAKGSITTGYRPINDDVEFFVEDTGIGISTGFQKKLFSHFTQEQSSLSRNYEGSGLGLSIAKGIVELLGGKISLQSEKGRGTRVHFNLPAEGSVGYEKVRDEKPGEIKGGNMVLIAEDDKVNRMVLETILEKANIKTFSVVNGREAVEACQKNPDIGLILMDVKMPVMGGIEATQIIKKEHPGMPIIATTAHAMVGDEARLREAGCDDYIAKPFSHKVVLEKVKEFVQKD